MLTEVEGEIDNNAIIVGNFNTHSQHRMDRADIKSICKQGT
jgi:hypothetical protein